MSNGLLDGGGGFADWDTTYVQNKENNMSSIEALFSNSSQPAMPTNSKLKPYKNQLASTQSNASNGKGTDTEYVNPFLVDFTANSNSNSNSKPSSAHNVQPSQQHKSKQPSVHSIQEDETLDAEVLDLLFDTNANATNPNSNATQNASNNTNANDAFYAFDFGLTENDNNHNSNNNSNTANNGGSSKLKENKRQPSSSDSYTASSDEEEDEDEEEEEEEEDEEEEEEEHEQQEEAEEASSDEAENAKGVGNMESLKLSPPKQQSKRMKKKRPSLTENEKAFNKLHTRFDPSLVGTVPVHQLNEKSKEKEKQQQKQKQKRNTEPANIHSERQKQLAKEGLITVGTASSLQSPNVGESMRDNVNDEDKKENHHKAAPRSNNNSNSNSNSNTKPRGKQKYNVLPELHRGTALLKYGRRGYPHFRQFNLTADNENLRWFSSKKKLQQSSINVGCINEILTGQHTKEFRRIAWTTLTPASFSVIYDNKKKSLNLVAKSVDEMKMWVEALRVLRDKKRRGEHLAKLESLEVDVDFRDRNRPQSRHHSGNFLRSHETKEREVDTVLQRKLMEDIAALRKQFQEIAREANNEIVQSTKEYESVEQILSELEERIEELDHEVRNTRNTKIAENDVWRTRIDLESLREKIKVITKQHKAQYKSSKRRWSVF